MIVIKTATEVIDLLGGNIAVGKLTSTTAKAVSNWRAFDRLPPNTYVVIGEALAAQGCTAPNHLWSMRPLQSQSNRRKA